MTVEDDKKTIRQHLRLLGHQGHGVTEFRVFKSPKGPMVAYADNRNDGIHLCLAMADKASGIYDRVLKMGYQPQCCKSFTDHVGSQPGHGTFQCSRIGTCPARAPMYIAMERSGSQQPWLAPTTLKQ